MLCHLHRHSNSVKAVRFSRDETRNLWDVAAALAGYDAPCQTVPLPGPYADMQSSGVTGNSEVPRTALLGLGAVAE